MLRVLKFATVLTLVTGCAGEIRTPPMGAEFVVAAGDSSFWVRSGAGGIELRRAPLTLARVGGRFYELYVTDVDRSYFDAVFVSQRLWRRDLLTNDSTLVFEDPSVERLARSYAASNPEATPLAPDEPESGDPLATATSDVEVVDIVGSFVTYETYADVHLENGEETHEVRRGVIDLRSGSPVTLTALLGDSVGQRVRRAGESALYAVFDSVLSRRDARAARVARSLHAFAFDEHSFALTAVNRRPGVAFLVPGHGAEGGGLALPLAPISAPSGAWWDEASEEVPEPVPNEATDRWQGAGYEVLARYDEHAERPELVLRKGRHEWPVGRLPAQASRIFWLDAPPLDSASRRALTHAFYDAQSYGEQLHHVMTPRGGPGYGAQIQVVAVTRNDTRTAPSQ